MNNKKQRLIICWLTVLSCLYLLSWTYTYDTDTPLGTDAPSVIDDRIREIKDAVQERENVDHYWPLTGTEVSDANAGRHRKVTLRTGETAAAVTNCAVIHANDVNSVAELFVWDESDNDIQLTSGGILNSLNLTGTQTAAGVKTFTSIPKVTTDPTDANELSRKDYVDTQIAAITIWTHDANQVYNSNAPTSWTDLDLSSYVGTNRAFCFIKCYSTNANGHWFAFRTNGESKNIAVNYANAGGCSAVALQSDGIGYVTIETDASGVVEWQCDTSSIDADLYLMGYIK